jgi:hypothetical protein
LLLSSTLRDSLLFRKTLANRTIEDVIYARIIANNSSNLLYNTVILKNRKEGSLLMTSAIAGYYRKYKENIKIPLSYINKIGVNSKEKIII